MSRTGRLAFIGLAFAWGIPYFLIEIALVEVSPIFLVFVRTFLAGIILLPFALAHLRQLRPIWRQVVGFTVIEISVPWFLISHAQQKISSSLAALLIAAVPIVAVVVGRISGRPEPIGRIGAVGLFLGMLGVGCIVGFDLSGSRWSAIAELLMVVFAYAVGAGLMVRWFQRVNGLAVLAVSLLLAAGAYAPFLGGNLPQAWPSAAVLGALLALAVICTAVGFLLMFRLVAEVGAVRATSVTYLNPAVAVGAGVIFLDERLSWPIILGFFLVVMGSILVNRPIRRTQPAG
ncbi:MAG: DMT family transporter [Angustibacter sp.]